jgi:hypothetical protein
MESLQEQEGANGGTGYFWINSDEHKLSGLLRNTYCGEAIFGPAAFSPFVILHVSLEGFEEAILEWKALEQKLQPRRIGCSEL